MDIIVNDILGIVLTVTVVIRSVSLVGICRAELVQRLLLFRCSPTTTALQEVAKCQFCALGFIEVALLCVS